MIIPTGKPHSLKLRACLNKKNQMPIYKCCSSCKTLVSDSEGTYGINNSCQALPNETTYIFFASPSQVYCQAAISAHKIAILGFSDGKGYMPCQTSEGPACSLFCGGRQMN